MTRSVFVLAFAASLSLTSATHAQPASAQAEVLFRQGRDLMADGKIAEACTAFQESQKLDPAVTTLLNLASCREKNNELATAWGLFLDAERQTRTATNDATKRLHEVAHEHALNLETRVSKLAINVPQASQVDGLEISRGSDRIDGAIWNRALPIDGGTYTITAHAPGASAWTATVTVGPEGDTKTVDVPNLRNFPRDLTREPAAHAGGRRAQSREPPQTSGGRVPVIVGASALAILGGSLGFELWGESNYSDAKAEMTDQARRDSLASSANTKRYVAEGLAVSGIALAGVAVWLYMHHRNEAQPERARMLVISPAGIAVAGGF